MSRVWLALFVASSVALPGAPDEATVRVSLNGRVTRLELEEYIARVVAGEGEPNAAPAAQQALAITARTFALANLNRHRREGFDLCDTTHCQVVRPATAATRHAAQSTAGRVLLHQGQPATVFYSALCGGHSELASQVWPGADDTSSHLHEDEACRDEPGWSTELTSGAIERALRSVGHRGRLRELRIVDRNASGRVARVRVDGLTPNELTGHDFRTAIARAAGYRTFRSTAFEVRRTGGTYRFSGTGFGHGVGLCVIGAGRRAAQGKTADAILKFYFPNLLIGLPGLQPGRTTRAGGAPERKPAPPAAAGAKPGSAAPRNAPRPAASAATLDVDVEHADAPDRAQIMQHVRAARDRIAKAAGLTPPATVRVTVHPTVDAFVRATGQPWWVSGSSDSTRIDLAPLAVLRQRAQLERTIRREVARLLTDAALNDRPMWVREGAAAYFADPAVQEGAARGSCPSDDELLRPLSAGEHRNALARAEGCFRRELARGRRWDQVR